jgi:hypothetical protein
MSNAENLEIEIKKLTGELEKARGSLNALQSNCRHDWTEIVYDPEEYKEVSNIMGISRAYPGEHIPYDEVPYRQSYSYITKYKDRWKRTCKKCNRVEFTEKFEEKREKTPKFT